jgi:hypothetical protein
MYKRVGIALIIASIIVAIGFLIAATFRNLTELELVMFQVFILGFSLLGSYIFGRESAQESAKDIIKPHARSAFRRLLSLYSSLSRLALAIQSARPANNSEPLNSFVLDRLESIVVEQIATANDALEDWRDIVPKDVEELHAKLVEQRDMEKIK